MRACLIGVPDPRAVREQIRNAAYEATGKQVFVRPTCVDLAQGVIEHNQQRAAQGGLKVIT